MILLADEASKKNLKVGVGLMWRHCQARQELCKRVQDGEIGDVVMMRAYRLHAPIGFFAARQAGRDQPSDVSDSAALPRLSLGQRRVL